MHTTFQLVYIHRITLVSIFLFCFVSSSAQFSMEGIIVDASSKEPLAFVNIGIAGTQEMTSSTIEGKFKLLSNQPVSEIYFSYVGYESLKYKINGDTKNIQIQLQQKSYELNAIEIVPGENPAHRIIKQAIANRDKNNPEKIRSYVCNTYSKTYYDFVVNDVAPTNKKDSLMKARATLFSEQSHVLLV